MNVSVVAVAHAYVIDRVAAVVNGHVITESEVVRAAETEALRRGLAGDDAHKALMDEALGSLIDRTLLLDEARRFNIVQITDEEVEDAFGQVRARFGSEDEFIEALGHEEITVEELKADLRDQLLAFAYVDKRVKFFIRVSVDDQKKYYEQNRERFGGREFSEVHDEIRELLTEKETAVKLEEYLTGLRAKSDIKIMGN
ncbi:MAG: SurA N-terminal domain-containing protein [Nitrospirae bacterium]|nr:SurA N-terminal domain-containing protein [Nitrospirota bacterium]